MNRGFGLSPTNKKHFKQRSSTLKLIESPIQKKNTRKNSIASKYEKMTLRVKKEPNLEKANNKILNFISNCMEKIKDDKNDEAHITPHLAGILEKQRFLKIERTNIKKEIQFNSSNGNNNDDQRAFPRKSYKANKVDFKNLSSNFQIHVDINNLNKVNFEQNIKSQRNNEIIEKRGSKNFKRIATSKFVKEKEREIVYNISSSLISLYKPNNNENFTNYIKKNNINKPKEPEKSKFKTLPKKKSLSHINDKFQKNKNKRKSSNEEKINSNFSIDNKAVKKPLNIKKFKTFIKLNHKNKIKNIKKRRNSPIKLIFNRSFFHNKSDKSLSLNDNNNVNNSNNLLEEKEENIKRNKETFNPLNWANELKNRENLTQIEYVHIGQDLRQSLIGYENKLEEEMKQLEKTETTDLIRHLPTMKNQSNNNKPSFCSNKFEDNLLNINITTLNLKDNKKFDKERFRLLQHTGYVYDSLDDEEAEDAIEINYYYISPDSIFIYIFDSIIAILSFYCIFYVPYYLAHDSFLNLSYLKFNNFFFHFIDIFYIIDLIISFFRAFYNYEEILIKNVTEMSCHYIKNWFFIDSLSAIPFYSIFFFFECKNKKIRNINYNPQNLNLNKFSNFGVKLDNMHYLIFMNKLLKIFKCFSDNNRALSKLVQVLFKSNIIEEKSDIFFVIFILFVTLNFGTCIFIFIGRNSYPSWINAMQIENESFTYIYLCSLYYLIATITTVGYGDIYGRTNKEIIFQIILLIIGTCTYSYLISVVSNFIKKINEKSLLFENKLKILNEIKLTNPHLHDSLYEKLLRFLRYKKNTEKNKQTIIINSLPYTLKNSLIIEMYKPIINNFMIFKGLQNSNCIVQLVTAFKPIYAIKNDILIQEGDFIEEVIFVKNGIISLEIGIDFNKPKESIAQYLDRMGKNEMSFSSINNNNALQDTTFNGMTETSTFFQNMKSIIKTDKKENKSIRYLKVLDIRKNEHFGETLMFFNERSFLNAKVKSKKAELFFLKKEEVIKIFSSFPNIWNRINKKSIYNMRQIKMTVRKVLLKFCNMVGINLENSIEKNQNSISFVSNNNKKKSKIKKDGKKNKENDDEENYLLNNIKKENRKKNKLRKSKTNCYNKSNYKDLISENNEKMNINEKMNLDKVINKNSIMSHSSAFENINKESTIYNIKNNSLRFISNTKTNNFSKYMNIEKDNTFKNFNSNELNESPNKIINNTFRGLDFNVKKNINNIENNNKNSYYSSKETVKVSMNKKVCTLIDSDSINDENQLTNIQYNINDEIYKNENFNINCSLEDESLKNKDIVKSYLNNNVTMEDLYKKVIEKTWVKNLDIEKVNYLDKLLNVNIINNNFFNLLNKESNLKKQEKNNIISHSHSSSYITNLEKTDIESFEILASYENINDITCNKYIKNQILRNKTKEFLLKECSNSLNEPKTNGSRISLESNFLKSMIFENTNPKRKNKANKMNSDSTNKSDKILRRKREIFHPYKRRSMKSIKYKRKSSSPKIKITTKSTLKNRHFMNISQLDIYKNNNVMRRSSKKNLETQNKSVIIADENMSFYDKYNTNNHSYDYHDKQSTVKKRKKQVSELSKIKDIIKKDAQNLNQPSLYYQQLFLNQIQKRKENKNNIIHKSNEYTLLPVSRNKISNNINLDIKRTSTELKNLKNNFAFSTKKYN